MNQNLWSMFYFLTIDDSRAFFAIFRKCKDGKYQHFIFLGKLWTSEKMVEKFFQNSNLLDFWGTKSEISLSLFEQKLNLSSSKKIHKSLEVIYRLHPCWNEPSDKVWSQSGVTILRDGDSKISNNKMHQQSIV